MMGRKVEGQGCRCQWHQRAVGVGLGQGLCWEEQSLWSDDAMLAVPAWSGVFIVAPGTPVASNARSQDRGSTGGRMSRLIYF